MTNNTCTTSVGGCSFIMFLGRILLSATFILSGVGKFMAFDETAAYMASKGIPMVSFFLYASAILEVAAGLLLLLGWHTRTVASLLLLFLIAVSLIMHNFWNMPKELAKMDMIAFMKNLAIMGGLLYAIATGPGKLSIDHLFRNKA